MKISLRILCFAFLFLMIWTPHIFAHQGEDHEKLKQVMQKADTLSGEMSYRLQEKDYWATAASLMELAGIFKSLETIIPAKGTKNEWDAIHHDLINAAFKAVGACGEEDGETVELYIQQIAEFMEKGHSIFK
ncbi:MAG: hypothetical protein GY801_42330 [bacterium]|nr:hypothetical protein [bacterium]